MLMLHFNHLVVLQIQHLERRTTQEGIVANLQGFASRCTKSTARNDRLIGMLLLHDGYATGQPIPRFPSLTFPAKTGEVY